MKGKSPTHQSIYVSRDWVRALEAEADHTHSTVNVDDYLIDAPEIVSDAPVISYGEYMREAEAQRDARAAERRAAGQSVPQWLIGL